MSNRARAAKRKTKLITKAIPYRPIFEDRKVYHTCEKPDCMYCVMNTCYENGDLIEATNDNRRRYLHILASGK